MKTILPILKTVVHQFPHKKVLEFGCGLNSTPYLYNNVAKLISIEEENAWFTRISLKLTRNATFETILENYILDCTATSPFSNLDRVSKTKLRKHYNKKSQKKRFHNLDILLVDNFYATRAYVLLAFYKNAKVSLYRIVPGKGNHGYELLKKENLSDYYHFSYQTFPIHTNLLIHKSVDFNQNAFETELKEQGRILSPDNNYIFKRI